MLFRSQWIEGKYQYNTRDHDYDPEWDYEPHENPNIKIDKKTKEIVEELRRDLIPRLGLFRNFTVFYVSPNSLGGQLGRYAGGTVSEPVIMLDLDTIKRSCREYKVDLDVGIETTIVHELGHAIQEASGLGDDEREAERFAHQWHMNRQVDKFWEKQ